MSYAVIEFLRRQRAQQASDARAQFLRLREQERITEERRRRRNAFILLKRRQQRLRSQITRPSTPQFSQISMSEVILGKRR
jgi:hypothetical protein